MDGGTVGGSGHQPVEHVQLAHQMALPTPPIDGLQLIWPMSSARKTDQPDTRAAASRGSRRFAAGMTATNDQNVDHRRALAESRRRLNDGAFHVKRANQI
jgi:hypothetical protein